jgi:hypothetical protein
MASACTVRLEMRAAVCPFVLCNAGVTTVWRRTRLHEQATHKDNPQQSTSGEQSTDEDEPHGGDQDDDATFGLNTIASQHRLS